MYAHAFLRHGSYATGNDEENHLQYTPLESKNIVIGHDTINKKAKP